METPQPASLNPMLLNALVTDAQSEAVQAKQKLEEMLNHLAEDQILAAVGAIDGLEERVHYVRLVMQRVAQLAVIAKTGSDVRRSPYER